MKQRLFLAVAALLVSSTPLWALQDPMASGKNLGNVRGGDFGKAHAVIQKRCTACHSATVIEAAMKANKDMLKIQREMEKRGAGLNPTEREVLGIYWKQNPLKKK